MKRKRIIFVVCYMAYMAVYVARINLSVAAPTMKQLSILTASQLGVLGSAFSIVYALGRLLNGMLSDRVRPAVMIVTGLVVTGASNLAFSTGQSFVSLLVFWITNAYGQSMLWSALLCVMNQAFEAEMAKRASSYLVTSVASGNIVAILLASFLLSRYNVRCAFIVPGIISIVLGGACLLVLGGVSSVQVRRTAQTRSMPIAKSVAPALLPALFHGAIKDNVTLWMSVIAVEMCGIDLDSAGGFVLLIPAIGLLGRTAYPFIYRICRAQEHVLSCGAFAVCALTAAALAWRRLSPLCVMLALGMLYAAASMINTSMVSIYPARFAAQGRLAAVSGIMDFVTYLGAGVGSTIYGILVERYGYLPMFVSWTLISLLSIVVLWYLQRQNVRLERKDETGG